MNKIAKHGIKMYVLIFSIVAIAGLHFSGLHGSLGLHGVHRELFFIPILLAAFWFGLKSGVVTAIIVSALFILGMVADSAHMPAALMISQVAVFIFSAALLGWLSDNQRKKTQELINAEKLATLGETVGVISWEVKDNIDALKRLFNKSDGLAKAELNKDFRAELDTIDSLSRSMTQYAAKETLNLSTIDINDAVLELVKLYKIHYREKGINLEVRKDLSGCPTKVSKNSVLWVLSKLLDNAKDASKAGASVFITTRRHGDHCTLDVEDQGSGIAEEHVNKLFTPFFTTKEGGTGISLAACKKTLKELGGDITARSVVGKGSVFTVTIPREMEK
nr:HAMP domain-containing sensor histidine kinase [Pseudodesulfovibrio sp.]